MIYWKFFLYTEFPVEENKDMQRPAPTNETAIIRALESTSSFAQLSGIRATKVVENPPFDIRFDLESGENRISVYAEIKQTISPKQLEIIAPWIARLKALEKDAAFAIISPVLSPQAQDYCIDAGIDFIDLIGNISINVPGKFFLQRTGLRSNDSAPTTGPGREVNIFSGRFSRILRVLLQNPRPWTLSEIARELESESSNNPVISTMPTDPDPGKAFIVSLGTISKALSTLEEQLWVRRRGSSILLPEPKRLLLAWAPKYRERYRARLRTSVTYPNPFGKTWQASKTLSRRCLSVHLLSQVLPPPLYERPSSISIRSMYIPSQGQKQKLKSLAGRKTDGPSLRFLEPYDLGVFMYARQYEGIPTVSDVQAYLDLTARGGRDQKQADYLFDNTIEPMWKAA